MVGWGVEQAVNVKENFKGKLQLDYEGYQGQRQGLIEVPEFHAGKIKGAKDQAG